MDGGGEVVRLAPPDTRFRQWLRILRASQRLGVREAALALGVGSTTWSNWELGHKTPSLRGLATLASWARQTYGCRVSAGLLLDWTTQPAPDRCPTDW